MYLVALGLNHQTAPLSVREKFVFPSHDLPEALVNLVNSRAISEAVIVSTCNRTEIYCNSRQPLTDLEWLMQRHCLPFSELRPYFYVLNETEATRHAFRVASGLDSMVLGETQILGQFKEAMRVAEQAGTLGRLLHALFQRAFGVAKEVRSKTLIGGCSVSIPAAAVKLIKQIFPSLGELSVLMIGAGEMMERVASHFVAHKPARMTVANRTIERAEALASRCGGNAITLADLPQVLSQYDVIVTSTASPLPIIGKGLVERAIKLRRHRPIFMLDIAVPRDIEEEVGELADVFLYTLDDMATMVGMGHEIRKAAVEQAEAIIEVKVAEFEHWRHHRRDVVPVIRALRDKADRTRRQVVENALKQLARGERPEKIIETLSVQLTNKLIHPPTQALAEERDTEHTQLLEAVTRLYRIHPETQ